MKKNFIIRNAVLSDARALSELVLACAKETLYPYYSAEQWAVFTKYYSLEAVEKKIGSQQVFCAEVDGVLAGTIALDVDFVLGFYTHPSFFRRGIGAQLLAHLEQQAWAQGVKVLELAASPVGIAFYEKRGWERVGEEDFYYEGVGFREMRMRREAVGSRQ